MTAGEIKVNDNYSILVDEMGYTVSRNLHRMDRRKTRDGTYVEYPAFKDVGYYSTLHSAIRGLCKQMVAERLSGRVESLVEAVESIREVQAEIDARLAEVVPDV